MKKYLFQVVFATALLYLFNPEATMAQSAGYKTPDQVTKWIKQVDKKYPDVVASKLLATTPGNRPVYVIEIGKEAGSEVKSNPSIFVGANLEGVRPIGTEGALFLAETILSDPAHYDSLNWYIVPLGNPDAASSYFDAPQQENSRNGLPVNDDRDDQTDEDGANDLNGDGWITQMRVKAPDGTWIVSEKDPRLLQKADPKKGEQGIYKLYSEGIDDDGDGAYNEDGAGGTNVEINFPHKFKHFTSTGGLYAGSAPESYAIMKYVFEHPEIAMIVSFGSTNFCYTPPKGGKKGGADLNKIRLTARQATQFNLDPSRTYTITELVALAQAENPQMTITESMVAGWLGLGGAVNPQPGDLVFYEKYAKEYKDYLKKKGVKTERLDPAQAKEGSFELWGYFQVGVPVFSMDLWGIPKPAAEKSNAKNGEKKTGVTKPGTKTATDPEPEKQKALIAYSDSLLGSKGFVEWKPFDHPTLGEVEIGGFKPYLSTTPPYEWVDSLLNLQVPWIIKLSGELPDLHIYEVKVSSKSSGVYQVEAWIENRAFIPFPTDMGSRNRQPAPAVLTLDGDQLKFLSGYQRTPIAGVKGKSRVKTTWIIQKQKPGKITLKLESKTAGYDQKTINIGG